MIKRRTLLAASAATALAGGRARAQGSSLKIGVLGDESGVYRTSAARLPSPASARRSRRCRPI